MPDRTEKDDDAKGPTGIGAEGAAGINAVSGREREEKGATEKGSEPLQETEKIHKPSYGGEGGKPRTSSDQREDVG